MHNLLTYSLVERFGKFPSVAFQELCNNQACVCAGLLFDPHYSAFLNITFCTIWPNSLTSSSFS